ncbi:MAG: glycosyltransferase family 4 protein [Bacteroidetes bacterium]|nr:glycosyltransferase family 4 protein [Bacteroidota bacterium]
MILWNGIKGVIVLNPRIVVFIPTLASGGAEKQALILTNILQTKYTTFLVIWDEKRIESKFKQYIYQNNIQFYPLRGFIFFRFFKLVLFLSENKINIVFNYLATSNFLGAIAGKFAGVSYIVGGIRNAEISRIKLIIQKYIHNYILNYTVFNNYQGCKNLVEKGFTSSKCIVIPNCFEHEKEHALRPLKSPVIIVTLARFVPQKDYFTALRTIQHLIIKYGFSLSDVTYRIIGYGTLEEQISNWIKELELQDYVEVLINPYNAMDLLKESDIFFMPSLFEGTSNSILEAMSFSLPVVATNVGDNSCLVEEGKNGFLSLIKDYKDLASNLSKLILDHELRISMGSNGHQKLYRDFSTKTFRESYLNFIDSLISGK